MNASSSLLPLRSLSLTQSLGATSYYTETVLTARHEFEHVGASPKDFGHRAEAGRPTATEVRFGRYRLLPMQFLLLEGDKPVRLGSRALEILIALLERAGELVAKHELMSRVWPDVFVEAANLTVHMSALRRVLHDGEGGNRFIINIPGRGYSFVGAVERVN
jgi:DNA-binding winged helix-turn-helix (wHTH) protein